jgi:cell division protein FtsB
VPHRVTKKRVGLLPTADAFVRRLARSNSPGRQRLIRTSLWVVGLWFAYSLAIGTYSLPRIIRLELHQSQLIEANRKQTVQLIDAARIRRLLSSDPGYLERIARTRHYMVYPGETIYRYHGE